MKNSVLTIRFIGERLKKQGMPIFELGHTFVSMQRLIHKAYLSKNERLSKGNYPERIVREQLSLQIGAHQKTSDFFSLIPMISDPAVNNLLSHAISYALEALSAYAKEKVSDYLIGGESERKQIYIASIHADVVNIVNRMSDISGCQSIEIG